MIEDVSKLDLSKFVIAEVKDNVDPDNEGKVSVFIPQLMYENEYDEEPFEEDVKVEVDKELVLNSKDFEDSEMELEESNYIWARPMGLFESNEPNWKYQEGYCKAGSLRIPRIGSMVLVLFFDSDLQKCYYLPISANIESNKIDSKNCINAGNYEDPEKRCNIDVIRMYWDGSRIEVDTNDHIIKITTAGGNYIKMSDEKIEIKGDTHIIGKLEVDNEASFKSTVNIDDLTTCNSTLDVQGTGYFNSGQSVNGSIMNNGINLTTHTHEDSTGGDTTSPN